METTDKRISFVFIGICCISLAAAFLAGISGNQTGITLCYIAATALVLAFVHRWRRMKNFLILAISSLVGFGVFVVLHNVFYGLAELTSGIIVLRALLEFLHAAFFIIAVMLCPVALAVGVVGSLLTLVLYFLKIN